MGCCGQGISAADIESVAKIGRAKEVVMARVFTARPGDARTIGRYGKATNTEACVVPGSVALELESSLEDGAIAYRVEFDDGEREVAVAALEAASAADEAEASGPSSDTAEGVATAQETDQAATSGRRARNRGKE